MVTSSQADASTKKTPCKGRPRNKAEREEARKKGSMFGYIKLPRGRPTRVVEQTPEALVTSTSLKTAAEGRPKRSNKPRGRYIDWTLPENSIVIQHYVDAFEKAEAVVPLRPGDPVPSLSTVRSWAERLDEHAAVSGKAITVEEWVSLNGSRKTRVPPLLSLEDRERLERVIQLRDARNDGMSRKEVVDLIAELAGAETKKADNHYCWLVRSKLLPNLRRNGKVVKAQKTTTKRSQVNVQQQLRWHTTIDHTFDELDRRNFPSDEWKKLRASGLFNLDEACIIGNDGNIQVVASNHRSKTEKNMDDCRESVSMLRCGSAAGDEGPWIFLAKGAKLDCNPLKNLERLGAPPHSKVVMTPSAYMTDEAWLQLVPDLCKGLRSTPVAKEHPEWWIAVTCDGFSSHLVSEALPVFSEHRILLVQEDGDSSQTNQPYDQYVAKADKRSIRDLLDKHRSRSKEAINQWSLIMICIEGLKKGKPESWIDSFKRVNLHPDYRTPFPDWIKKIDSQLQTGERFFKGRSSLYDAMPVLWRNMDVDMRENLVVKIDQFYNEADADTGPWCPKNVLWLTAFVPLDKIVQLRACYLTAKRDPAVITQIAEEVPNDASDEGLATTSAHAFFESCKLLPKDLLAEYKKDKTNEEARLKLFRHITNRACRSHWTTKSRDPGPLAPSDWLDVSISEDQKSLLTPSTKDLLFFTVESEAYGEHAKKKRARRRQDLVDGNAKSYSRILNSETRLEAYRDYNSLQAAVAEVRRDKDEQRENAAAEKKRKEAEKEKKKLNAKEAENKKKEEMQPGISDDLAKGEAYIQSLKVGRLRDILVYRFGMTKSAANKLTKQNLLIAISGQMAAAAGAGEVNS